jgi:uncharacterized protein
MLLIDVTIGPSPIHGIGVFAARPIEAGEIIWIFAPGQTDLVATTTYLRTLPQSVKEFWCFYGHRIDPALPWTVEGDLAKFFNHSDDPNTGPDPTSDESDLRQIAYRPLAVGEEITVDYHTFSCDVDVLLSGCTPAEMVAQLLG